MKTFALAALFAVGLGCVTVQAQQPEPDGSLELREAIDATLKANPELAGYSLRAESLEGLRASAALAPALRLGANAENIFGTGALNGTDGAEYTLTLSSVIELGNKADSRVGVANRRLELLAAQQRVTQLDLLAETTRRYIAVATAQELMLLQRSARDLAQQNLARITTASEAGQSPALEVARAEASLVRARIAESYALSARNAASIELSSMWGSQSPQFNEVNAALFDVGEAGSLQALLDSFQSNPDLEQLVTEERLLQAQLQQVQTDSRGNVEWTAGIRHLQELGDTGLVLNFSLPLGSASRNSGEIASATADLAELDARRKARLNSMRARLYSLHLQLQQAINETLTLRDEVLPLLDSVLVQTRDAWISGLYNYQELIDTQQEFLDTRLSLIESAGNVHLLRVELERLSGSALNSAPGGAP